MAGGGARFYGGSMRTPHSRRTASATVVALALALLAPVHAQAATDPLQRDADALRDTGVTGVSAQVDRPRGTRTVRSGVGDLRTGAAVPHDFEARRRRNPAASLRVYEPAAIHPRRKRAEDRVPRVVGERRIEEDDVETSCFARQVLHRIAHVRLQRQIAEVPGARDERTNSPVLAIAVTTLAGALGAALLDFGKLVDISVTVVFIQYMGTCLAVLALRRTRPELPYTWRLPGGATIPLLAVIVSIALLFAAKPGRREITMTAIILGIGMLAYAARRRFRKS